MENTMNEFDEEYEGREQFIDWLENKVCAGMSEGRLGTIRPNFQRACEGGGWIYKRELACWISASIKRPTLKEYFQRLTLTDVKELVNGLRPHVTNGILASSPTTTHADRIAYVMMLLSLEDYYVIAPTDENGGIVVNESVVEEYNSHMVETIMMLARTGMRLDGSATPEECAKHVFTFFPNTEEHLS